MEIQRMTHRSYLHLTNIMSRPRGETIIGVCRSVWTQLNTYVRMTQWESSHATGVSQRLDIHEVKAAARRVISEGVKKKKERETNFRIINDKSNN